MIEIEIRGDAANLLSEFQSKLNNLGGAMREVAAYTEKETRLNFVRQSDPDGAPWQPLAPSTLRRKRGSGILRESGALMAGISSSSSKLEARVTSAGPFYNVFHQSGTKRTPQRKFIGLSDRYTDPIIRIIKNHLDL